MGTNIYYHIEIRKNEQWKEIPCDFIFYRNYDLFGFLFGVRNYANFNPIFAKRGLPSDASTQVNEKHFLLNGRDPSYCTLEEIQEINWDQESLYDDERIHEYQILEDGSKKYISKFSSSSKTNSYIDKLKKERSIIIGDRYYCFEKINARQTLDNSEFYNLINIMKRHEKHYNSKDIRLIVYFC